MELEVEVEEALILEVDDEEACAQKLTSSFSAAATMSRLITCRWCTARLSATLYKPSISYYQQENTIPMGEV